MNKTKIETSEYTWNPMTGCDQICFNGDCYAYQLVERFGSVWGYDWTPQLHEKRLNEPLNIKNPSLIFSPSMGDLFTPTIKHDEIQTILDIMKDCPQHRFQLQTKFPERLNHFDYPSNVWLGVSICYKRDESRLNYLRATNARIKYAYCEPLLEEIDPNLRGIDWVVIGAKTGARPFIPDNLWIIKLVRKCIAQHPFVPVFMKSNLKYPPPGALTPTRLTYFPDQEWFDSRNEPKPDQGSFSK